MSQLLAQKDKMLEYFTYKKVKKHQADKKAREESESQSQSKSTTTTTPTVQEPLYLAPKGTAVPAKPAPVLSPEDERFLDGIIVGAGGGDEGERPPLPLRPSVGSWTEAGGDASRNKSQLVATSGVREGGNAELDSQSGEGLKHSPGKGKGKEKEKVVGVDGAGKEAEKDAKKTNRFSFLQRTFTKKGRNAEAKPVVTADEAAAEKDDINKVLDDLNLAAVNNRAFSISQESQILIQKFTVILKDLVNGVPTAYDDLTHLLDSSQETLEKSYEALPSFLKKLVVSLPTKLTGTLAPELLAVATEAQGLNAAGTGAGAAGSAGLGAAAKNFLSPTGLKDLVTKPGAVVTMLKTIMNALKLRWPAFMGTNVLLSLGLFVLLFVFWYCHKRGREERLKRESAVEIVDSEGRIVELEDDPMLPPAGPSGTRADGERLSSSSRRSTRRDERKEREKREKGEKREKSRELAEGTRK